VFYRTDYSDNIAFDTLVELLRDSAYRDLEKRSANDLKKFLEITIKADREQLDNVSLEQVQNHFTEWTTSYEANMELNDAADRGAGSYPRYTCCLVADSEVMSQTQNAREMTWVKILLAKIVCPTSEAVEEMEEEIDMDGEGQEGGIETEVARILIIEAMPRCYAELLRNGMFETFDYWRVMHDEHGQFCI
jgi:hypothetical protein